MTAIAPYQPGQPSQLGSSPGTQVTKQPQAPASVGYLSIGEAARYASVSTRTIKRWITRGLPVYQGTHRGKVLIRPGDIDLYLQRKTVPKPDLDLDALVQDVLAGLGGPKPEPVRPRERWARA